jgi:hypothetical protein
MSRHAELTAKVDAFFARAYARHGDDMQCGTGCSDCCDVRLTVTAVEAAAIRAELARWEPARRDALAANARAVTTCGALKDGRCLIYAVRPVVCRSHGAPIRMIEDRTGTVRQGSEDRTGTVRNPLPVIQSCHRNFTRVTPDPDCILDQQTLSALVLAVDRDAGGDGSRVDLVSLLV